MQLVLRTVVITIVLLSFHGMAAWAGNERTVEPDQTTGSVSGFTEDSLTKETLVGATVSVKGTKLGSYTNKSGFFSISRIPPGAQTLVVTMIGYQRKEIPITVVAGASEKLKLEVSPSSIRTQEVSVTADRQDDKRTINVSRVNIPMAQIQQMRIGGEADIFRAIQMLPGVLASSQVSSGLFIRGGSPDQTLVMLDGMTVYNPTHIFGFISAFNSDAVKDVELIKGGYPAEYGGRMSSVLNITQKEGNREKVQGLVALGTLSSRASIQGPLFNGSWFVGARRSYLDLILSVVPDDPANPLPDFNFYDVNVKLTQNFGASDKVSISGLLTRDNLIYAEPAISFGIGIGNRAGSVQWTHVFGDDLFLTTTASASRYQNDFNVNNSGLVLSVENSITDYTGRTQLEWYSSDEFTAKFGYEITAYEFGYLSNLTGNDDAQPGDQGFQQLQINDLVHSAYGQMNVQVTPELNLQGGLRVNYWGLNQSLTFDPRVAARYQITDDIVVKGSWGLYNQYLRLASAPDFSFFDTWLPTDNTIPVARSVQYVAAIETRPFEDMDFNVDVYYKQLNGINELRRFSRGQATVADVFYIGTGEAYGIEFFVQRKMGRLTGWVGYALGFVTARFDSVNQGAEFRPKYDRRHDFKVTGSYHLSDQWDLTATWVFQSGQSYTGATSWFNGTMPDFTNSTVGVSVPSQRWGLRLPNSHQLNLNATYTTTLFDLPFAIMLDIFNMYSRRDILVRFFDTTKPVPQVTDVRLLPIIPSFSVELRF
jgi:hypothetical protein